MIGVRFGILCLISLSVSLRKHAQAVVVCLGLGVVQMLIVGVLLSLKLAILVVAAIAAPSGLIFF